MANSRKAKFLQWCIHITYLQVGRSIWSVRATSHFFSAVKSILFDCECLHTFVVLVFTDLSGNFQDQSRYTLFLQQSLMDQWWCRIWKYDSLFFARRQSKVFLYFCMYWSEWLFFNNKGKMSKHLILLPALTHTDQQSQTDFLIRKCYGSFFSPWSRLLVSLNLVCIHWLKVKWKYIFEIKTEGDNKSG